VKEHELWLAEAVPAAAAAVSGNVVPGLGASHPRTARVPPSRAVRFAAVHFMNRTSG